MRDKEKKTKRRGRHAEGAAEEAGYQQVAPGARPPDLAGRQVYPPTAEQQYAPVEAPQQYAAPQAPGQAQPPVQQPPQPFEEIPVQPPVQPVEPQPPVPHPPPTVVSQEPYGVQPPAQPVEPAPQPVVQPPPLVQQAPPQPPVPEGPPAGEAAPTSIEPPAQPEAPPAAPAQQQEAPGFFPPGTQAAPGYFMPPPWYPPPYTMPPPYFGYPGPGQTGPMPVVPGQPPLPPESPPLPPAASRIPPPGPFGPGGPMTPPGFPVGMYPPMGPAPLDMMSLEEPEFESLTRGETSHWRVDLKWIFGVITSFFILLALISAGLYQVTGPGAAKQVMVPIIENATQVKQLVKGNYQELRSKARKSRGASIYIPDIGITITLKGGVIASLSADDLADRVIAEAEKQIYAQGYKESLPMKAALGAGEERAKAVFVTILSEMNRKTHNDLLWPIIIFGVLALAFGILFIVFCRGWGKVAGAGIAFIMSALPASLMLRIGHQFVWKAGAAGTYRPAANQALRTISSLVIAYFDIALAFGALVLLVGVIGAVIARKSRERVPPFTELKQPASLLAAPMPPETGGQEQTPVDAQSMPQDTGSFFLDQE
jgi:hypothetical protein